MIPAVPPGVLLAARIRRRGHWPPRPYRRASRTGPQGPEGRGQPACTTCDQNLCNETRVDRSPEYEALLDLTGRVAAGFEEREKARDEAPVRTEELQRQHSELREEYHRAFDGVYGTGE